jgi:hypothetical protein
LFYFLKGISADAAQDACEMLVEIFEFADLLPINIRLRFSR